MREQVTLSRRALAKALPFAIAAPTMAAASVSDPVFARIEEHKALRHAIELTSSLDKDPGYKHACETEEAALQALGDTLPTSIVGAAALLTYMAEVEGDFADAGSPLLRTVLSVAEALSGLSGRPLA